MFRFPVSELPPFGSVVLKGASGIKLLFWASDSLLLMFLVNVSERTRVRKDQTALISHCAISKWDYETENVDLREKERVRIGD